MVTSYLICIRFSFLFEHHNNWKKEKKDKGNTFFQVTDNKSCFGHSSDELVMLFIHYFTYMQYLWPLVLDESEEAACSSLSYLTEASSSFFPQLLTIQQIKQQNCITGIIVTPKWKITNWNTMDGEIVNVATF